MVKTKMNPQISPISYNNFPRYPSFSSANSLHWTHTLLEEATCLRPQFISPNLKQRANLRELPNKRKKKKKYQK